MKLLQTIFVLSYMCSIGRAQGDITSISINYKANDLPLVEIFRDLSEKYDIQFSYATESLSRTRHYVLFLDTELSSALNQLLINSEMEYKILDNNVLIRKTRQYTTVLDSVYQSSYHIRGRIIEEGGQGLDFATVLIDGTDYGTYTNSTGFFDIEIPERHMDKNLTVHYLGYDNGLYVIEERKEELVLIALKPSVFFVDEIIIANREKSIRVIEQTSEIRPDTRVAKTIGGWTRDLSRQVQFLPGISAFDDGSADIKIRGGSRDETMLLLDNIPLYNPSHFYGIFSSINSLYLDKIKVYKNNYPVQYGGKTGGLVDISSLAGGGDQMVNLEIDLLSAKACARVELSNDVRLTLAGRTTYSNVSNTQFYNLSSRRETQVDVENITEVLNNSRSDPSFRFSDFNGKLDWTIGQSDEISINFYNSMDRFDHETSRRIQDNRDDRIMLDLIENEDWDNLGASTIYKHTLSDRLQLYGTAHWTRYQNNAAIDYKVVQQVSGRVGDNLNLSLDQQNQIRTAGSELILKADYDRQYWTLGGSLMTHAVDFSITENGQNLIQNDGEVYETNIFSSYAQALSNTLDVEIGLRGTYYNKLNRFYYSPRISFSNKSNEDFLFKGSYGLYNQFVRELEYEYRGASRKIWVYADQGISDLRSHNFMLGSTIRVKEFTIDLEAYYKFKKGVLEYAVLNPGDGSLITGSARDYKLFTGDGVTRGLDVLISRSFSKVDSYLSYTLSKSTERYREIAQGAYLPSPDDRRHQLQWSSVWIQNKFSFGTDFIYASGRRYTNLRRLGDTGDIRTVRSMERFQFLPAYIRLDIGVKYSTEISKCPVSLGFSVFNVLDNKNVKYVQSVVSNVTRNQATSQSIVGNEVSLLGRLFNLNLSISI